MTDGSVVFEDSDYSCRVACLKTALILLGAAGIRVRGLVARFLLGLLDLCCFQCS